MKIKQIKSTPDNIRNLTFKDFLNEKYENINVKLNEEMYSKSLNTYQYHHVHGNFDEKTYSMILCTLLMDNKDLLITTKYPVGTEFYQANKDVIDFCIDKTLRDTRANVGEYVCKYGWNSVPEKPNYMDKEKTLVCGIFGDGISWTSATLWYSSDETIMQDITEYTKNSKVPFVLTKKKVIE